jgi:hypothetical protein
LGCGIIAGMLKAMHVERFGAKRFIMVSTRSAEPKHIHVRFSLGWAKYS